MFVPLHLKSDYSLGYGTASVDELVQRAGSLGYRAAEEARRKRYQGLVRVRNELEYLEMHLSAHPMSLLRDDAERAGCVTIAKAMESAAGQSVRLAAVVAAMRRTATRQGAMQFITFDDETGMIESVVFPAQYQRLGERVTTPGQPKYTLIPSVEPLLARF